MSTIIRLPAHARWHDHDASGRTNLRISVIGLNYAPEPTGIAVYTSGLAEGLADRGHRVKAITGIPHYPQWRPYAGFDARTERETRAGVHVTRLKHVVPARPRLLNRLRMELHFGLRSVFADWGRPDVVVLVTPALFAAGLATVRARLTGTRTCVWVQDIYSLGVSESGIGGRLAGRVLTWIESRILRSASSVVVIHDRFKRHLVHRLGVDPSKVEVVRNWSHIDCTETGGRDDIRRARSWARDDIVVLHAGNMGAKQGLENVVEASRLAAASGSPVRFVLLGDGNQREALERMGANSHLQFIDPLGENEFMPTLRAADILLVNERPGLTEMSVPSKLTSYFSTGRPVLAATDLSSVTAEEMALAQAGVRVDAADPAALVAQAEALGRDQLACVEYGGSGLAFRADYLTEENALNLFERILDAGDGAVTGARHVARRAITRKNTVPPA